VAAKGVYPPWRALPETDCLIRAKIGVRGGCLLAKVFGVSATIRIEFTPPWGKRC